MTSDTAREYLIGKGYTPEEVDSALAIIRAGRAAGKNPDEILADLLAKEAAHD